MRSLFSIILFITISSTNAQMEECFDPPHVGNKLNGLIDMKYFTGVTVGVSNDTMKLTCGAGELAGSESYFIASTTKLFVVALVMQLVDQQLMQLQDPIQKYLTADIMQGLHVYKGVDHSAQITIEQLLAQTSGLPDYFGDKGPDGTSLEERLIDGEDRSWTAEEAIAISKTMKPKFAPGTSGKAHYSDTNYQLLGLILQNITSRSFAQLVQERISLPLGLTSTYVYTDTADAKPYPLRYKNSTLKIPLAMTSVTADGGIVSTTDNMLIFIRAFFEGKLFDVQHIQHMQQWNKIFPPFEYGTGLMQFTVPKIFTLGRAMPMIIGHSGLSGAFAFYCPEKHLFLVGTVNQLAKPSTSYKLMMQIISDM